MKSAFTVLGMMIIGLTFAVIPNIKFDFKFLSLSLFIRFLIWPLLALVFVWVDYSFMNSLYQPYYKPIGAKSWFACGGNAEVLFKPKDVKDLQFFLKKCPSEVPISVFGAMSNVIVRDGGIEGVVIRLGREFSSIDINEEFITAGALALDANVAVKAAQAGVAGLEFFSGIPGAIGGALKMNAGCYGVETKDVLVSCEVVDRQGNLHRLTPEDMGMTYRHTTVPDNYIFLSAKFKGIQENPEIVEQRIKNIKEKREKAQPIREKTGGSTFANPSEQDLSARK